MTGNLRALKVLLIPLVISLLALSVPSRAAVSRAAPAGARCEQPDDALARVQCSGHLRVGLRTGYAPFSSWQPETPPQGFEPDLALALARGLGVRLQPVLVTPANRLAMLGEGKVDVVIATMGHTLQRDTQALFIRPHYFQSMTAVVGQPGQTLRGLGELAQRPVCVTVGNLTNAELAAQGARLMLFDSGAAMIEQMRLGGCRLAAQDDTFFTSPLREPGLAGRREVKFGFAPTPWGMAVSQRDGQALADRLAQQLQALHASGELLSIAGTHGVASDFLSQEQQRWSQPPCSSARPAQGQPAPPACLRPPRDAALTPTAWADEVEAIENGFLTQLGWRVSLPMLKTQVALGLFLDGVMFSLALVLGAVLVTVLMTAGFAQGLRSGRRPVRWLARLVQAVMQSTPLVLLMLVCDAVITALQWQSPLVSLAAAVLVLGLFNGSNAGQAVAEAALEAERNGPGRRLTLKAAMARARAQVMSFAVNATRGSPAAAVMGVPELLSAQTDISSFVSERATTYTLLLVFYVGVVLAVIAVARRIEARWATRVTP